MEWLVVTVKAILDFRIREGSGAGWGGGGGLMLLEMSTAV